MTICYHILLSKGFHILRNLIKKKCFKIPEILENPNADTILDPAQKFYRSCLDSGNICHFFQ